MSSRVRRKLSPRSYLVVLLVAALAEGGLACGASELLLLGEFEPPPDGATVEGSGLDVRSSETDSNPDTDLRRAEGGSDSFVSPPADARSNVDGEFGRPDGGTVAADGPEASDGSAEAGADSNDAAYGPEASDASDADDSNEGDANDGGDANEGDTNDGGDANEGDANDGGDSNEGDADDGGEANDGGDAGLVCDYSPYTAAFSATPGTWPPWDGGAPKVFLSSAEVYELALDDTNVYWSQGGGVVDCPVSGCPGHLPLLLSDRSNYKYTIEDIAVGASTVFFFGPQSLQVPLEILSCGSGGCFDSPSTLWASPGASDGGNGVQSDLSPFLVTDTSNVYFTDGASLYACPVGTSCPSPFVLLSGSIDPLGPLAVSGGDLYYVDSSPSAMLLRAIPITGGTPRVVCESSALAGAASLVVAGGYAYFTSYCRACSNQCYPSSAPIFQCPADGSSPTPAVFVTDVDPTALAADGSSLYWTNWPDGASTVATCALGAYCADPRLVGSVQDYVSINLAVNASAVFWAGQETLYWAAK
jgi:hypothetical protein